MGVAFKRFPSQLGDYLEDFPLFWGFSSVAVEEPMETEESEFGATFSVVPARP